LASNFRGPDERIAADAPGELHVADHESDPASVKSAEVAVFEQASNVGLGSLLEAVEGGS